MERVANSHNRVRDTAHERVRCAGLTVAPRLFPIVSGGDPRAESASHKRRSKGNEDRIPPAACERGDTANLRDSHRPWSMSRATGGARAVQTPVQTSRAAASSPAAPETDDL